MSEAAVKPPTILVIDDDAEIRYSLARVLSSRNYIVTEAPSGEQGIAIVKKGPPPDLVFLDVRMSGMSGIEALQHIRSANPKQLGEYRSGKDKLFGFFVGQVMKVSAGKANPDQVNALLKKKLAP